MHIHLYLLAGWLWKRICVMEGPTVTTTTTTWNTQYSSPMEVWASFPLILPYQEKAEGRSNTSKCWTCSPSDRCFSKQREKKNMWICETRCGNAHPPIKSVLFVETNKNFHNNYYYIATAYTFHSSIRTGNIWYSRKSFQYPWNTRLDRKKSPLIKNLTYVQ